MLGDIKYCRLVEQFNDERKGYLIEKNDEKWETTVVPKLRNFCEIFHSLLSEGVWIVLNFNESPIFSQRISIK